MSDYDVTELPGGAGGAEVDVAFLYVPRREDKTYAGTTKFGPAPPREALPRSHSQSQTNPRWRSEPAKHCHLWVVATEHARGTLPG